MNSLLELEYDVDIEDCSFDEENTINPQNSNVISFYNEIEPIIKQCIKNYFFDKVFHNGGKIPNCFLELPYYSSLLFNTTVSDGVIKAYFLMDEAGFIPPEEINQNIVGEEVRYMLDLISDIQKRIPQEFIGGMILMHLELVEGIEIW